MPGTAFPDRAEDERDPFDLTELHRARRDAAATLDEHARPDLRTVGAALDGQTVTFEIRDLLIARLKRDGHRALADAIEAAIAGRSPLSPEQQAELDAILYGHGYVHDGQRLDPRKLRVYRPPTSHDAL